MYLWRPEELPVALWVLYLHNNLYTECAHEDTPLMRTPCGEVNREEYPLRRARLQVGTGVPVGYKTQ